MALQLKREIEDRLESFARHTGQGSSDVAQLAIEEYLRRHDGMPEFERQAREIAALEAASPESQAETAALNAQAWRTADRLD